MDQNQHIMMKHLLIKAQQVQTAEPVDYQKMTAPCGLPCYLCSMHLAGKHQELLTFISASTGIPPEQVPCSGCRNESGKCAHHPMPCRVFPCAEKKGLDFCFDCHVFPCDYLHPYGDMADQVWHNTKVFNLCLINKMGLEEWAVTKAENVRDTYCFGMWTL